MRIISGTLKSTPPPRQPDLCEYSSYSRIRREDLLGRELEKYLETPDIPIYDEIQIVPPTRPKSRKSGRADNASTYDTPLRNVGKKNGKRPYNYELVGNQILCFQDLTFKGESGRGLTAFVAVKERQIN